MAKNRTSPSFYFLFFLVVALPSRAFAYGDPSGGLLFQMLTPLAALLWGAWLIFANSVRKRFGVIARRLGFSGRSESNNESAEEAQDEN